MKLYLSSYRVPDREALFELFDKKPESLEGAILVNAKDNKPAEERQQKLNDLRTDLARTGLKNTVFVDLLEFNDARRVGHVLAQYDFLYAAGGNVFSLRSAMAKSGFDFAISHLLEAGQVYIGESAGAVVAGPSIRGFASVDALPKDETVEWSGLSLVDTIVVPHNDSSDVRYANRAPLIARENPHYQVQPLNDNQAVVVSGGQARIVTARS